MKVEEATLPEDVDTDNVSFDDDQPKTIAYVQEEGEFEDHLKPFNPQNGRYYETTDPGCAQYNNAHAYGGLPVNCAYEDCDGHTTIEVEGSISYACSSCGEPMMGRKQFTSEETTRRSKKDVASTRIDELSDEFASEMNRVQESGVATTPAFDYLMCSVGNVPISEWAQSRGVYEKTIKANLKKVENALGENIKYQL